MLESFGPLAASSLNANVRHPQARVNAWMAQRHGIVQCETLGQGLRVDPLRHLSGCGRDSAHGVVAAVAAEPPTAPADRRAIRHLQVDIIEPSALGRRAPRRPPPTSAATPRGVAEAQLDAPLSTPPRRPGRGRSRLRSGAAAAPEPPRATSACAERSPLRRPESGSSSRAARQLVLAPRRREQGAVGGDRQPREPAGDRAWAALDDLDREPCGKPGVGAQRGAPEGTRRTAPSRSVGLGRAAWSSPWRRRSARRRSRRCRERLNPLTSTSPTATSPESRNHRVGQRQAHREQSEQQATARWSAGRRARCIDA